MCEQKCYLNGKVRETLSYLSEDWFNRMVLHNVNEKEITGSCLWPQKKDRKVHMVCSQNFVHGFIVY